MRGSDTDSAPAALRKLIERAGMTNEAVSLAAGYRQASGLQRYVLDDYPARYFQLRIADKLAKVLVGRGQPPISAEELYQKLAGTSVPLYMAKQLDVERHEIASNVREADDMKPLASGSMVKDIPVKGVGAAGKRGDFTLNGDTVDRTVRFPGIAHRQGVFAIYAVGSSMFPWRSDGDPVYLDTVRPPKPGDYVLVECKGAPGEPGPAYLKQLKTQTNRIVRLAQFNPPNVKIEIPLSTVKAIYRVIDWKELFGL